jgi:hypothetical protein
MDFTMLHLLFVTQLVPWLFVGNLDRQNIVIQIELDSYTEFFPIEASYKINKLTLSFRG